MSLRSYHCFATARHINFTLRVSGLNDTGNGPDVLDKIWYFLASLAAELASEAVRRWKVYLWRRTLAATDESLTISRRARILLSASPGRTMGP